ncbi:MAG TPA: serine protease [Elusimicrobia bacterium]|nr:MAG: hypothetical protein A2016_04915 [Elusimicrobia bacterium GWF2_62_30]HBA60563.1 serine protease [Elusimicrobiota bacterium]
MKNLMKATLSIAAIVALPVLSFSAGKSIYGSDDRLNYYEASAGMQTLADSVVSFWKSYKVTENAATGKMDLTVRTLGDAKNLCPGQKFRDENVGAFCSGSLVGEDIVMTAGHCVKTETDCAATKLVFGFKVGKAGEAGASSVAKSEVYSCSSIVKRYLVGEPGSPAPAGQTLGADYALIKLDRKVTGHKVAAVNRNPTTKKGDKLFVIGHPSGLPLKVAGGAVVRDASKIGYFIADLDTFGGNSGSAVFNASNNKIEGILVRGDNDYISTPAGCNSVATFEQTGGRGEDVTKIAVVSPDIPKMESEKDSTEYTNVDSKGLTPVKAAPKTTIGF